MLDEHWDDLLDDCNKAEAEVKKLKQQNAELVKLLNQVLDEVFGDENLWGEILDDELIEKLKPALGGE